MCARCDWEDCLVAIDWEDLPCMHPEHNPPGSMVYEPGIYEYECPACGYKQTITVRGTYTVVSL